MIVALDIRGTPSSLAHPDHRVTVLSVHRAIVTGQGAPHVIAHQWKEYFLQVFVRDNNIDQELRALNRKMQREGIFRNLKRRRANEKPSEKEPGNSRRPFAAAESSNAKRRGAKGLCREPDTLAGTDRKSSA